WRVELPFVERGQPPTRRTPPVGRATAAAISAFSASLRAMPASEVARGGAENAEGETEGFDRASFLLYRFGRPFAFGGRIATRLLGTLPGPIVVPHLLLHFDPLH